MRFFEKGLIIFSCIGLSCFSLEAKSLSISFDHSITENYFLEDTVNQSPFCERLLVVENRGPKPVFDCLPISNDREFLSLDKLAQLLAKEKQPLMALFHQWQKVLPTSESKEAAWSNISALDCLNFLGNCPAQDYQKKFVCLCHQLGIDTRQVTVKGKTVYDFNCKKEEWSFLDVFSSQFYLGWDNKTLLSSEGMMDDPLLVIRTKPVGCLEEMDFVQAWQNFACLEVINPSEIDDEIIYQPEVSANRRGFDLYPQETLVYVNPGQGSNPYQVKIEHNLNLDARRGVNDNSYYSPFPIQEIYNGTNTPLYLKNEKTVVQPLKSYSFDNLKVFSIIFEQQKPAEGTVKVTSACARRLLPTLQSGENSVSLGTNENPGNIKVTFELEEDASRTAPQIRILNNENHFNSTSPHIFLTDDQDNQAVAIKWQISTDVDFKIVPSNFAHEQEFTPEITFLPITETFFNPDDTYYFRAKGMDKHGNWGPWSSAFNFTIKKPDSVNLIEFDQIDEKTYLLDWTREAQLTETPIDYLIFGSNAYDFVPSIYTSTQINEIMDGKVISKESNNNLIAITNETKFTVDGSLAYYRIIARQNGVLSVPSPIIHVYGNELVQPRTLLQIVDNNLSKFIAKRILFPPAYPWTETALPRLGVQNRLYENSLLKLKDFVLKAAESSKTTSDLIDSDYITGEAYIRPSHVTPELWEKMRPYFLPENHPWKKKIDRIFKKSRASQNPEAMKKAGFKGRITGVRRIFAGIHPDCIECFFKIYLDSEHTKYIEWQKWIDRITGKNRVKACIKKYGFEKSFSTPEKWVYPLPEKPACSKSAKYNPKNFILCCSNQRPYEHSENEKMWKRKLTRQHLDALYILIDEPGMWDSVFAFNIPFCKVDGKLCFVDTEYSHKWPIRFEKLNRYFSSENVKYWEYLIRNNGPKGYKSPHPAS